MLVVVDVGSDILVGVLLRAWLLVLNWGVVELDGSDRRVRGWGTSFLCLVVGDVWTKVWVQEGTRCG